ncbi:MAG: response regulator [Thiobacillus sp.]|nr:response regulator [Thiobacillus sp.]
MWFYRIFLKRIKQKTRMLLPIADTLAELRRQFTEQLSARMDAVRAHVQDLAVWNPAEAEALHRLVQRLTSSAGLFDMQPMSAAAFALEARLAALLKEGAAPTETEWQAIGNDLERMDQLACIPLSVPAQPLRLDRSPLILMLEADPVQAGYLSQALQDDGYRVQVFAESAGFCAACMAADAEHPAAVVMEVVFPDDDAAGAELLAKIKANQARRPPVVLVSARDDLAARLAAFRAGACRYLVKPVDPGRLIELLDALTGRQPPQPYRVLLVTTTRCCSKPMPPCCARPAWRCARCRSPCGSWTR